MTRHAAGTALVISFGVAVMLNAIEVLVDPDGWAWWGVRMVVSAAFSLALVLWVYVFIRDRRTRT